MNKHIIHFYHFISVFSLKYECVEIILISVQNVMIHLEHSDLSLNYLCACPISGIRSIWFMIDGFSKYSFRKEIAIYYQLSNKVGVDGLIYAKEISTWLLIHVVSIMSFEKEVSQGKNWEKWVVTSKDTRNLWFAKIARRKKTKDVSYKRKRRLPRRNP